MSSLDPKAYNIPAKETEKVHSNHINGTQDEINARFCIQELCKGWPVYRDFSEWHNYRSLFTKEGAYVWTSTSKYLLLSFSLFPLLHYILSTNTEIQLGLAVCPLTSSSRSLSRAAQTAISSLIERMALSPTSI